MKTDATARARSAASAGGSPQRKAPLNARLRATRARGAALYLLCAGVEPCLAAGEFVDRAATVLAVIVIIVVPVAAIALFWLVHVLPEKIAAKREHPQKDAIHVLCLLSLVFGGLLWPLAWLWAYSKPVLYKMAYGRDRHDDYYAGPMSTAAEPVTDPSTREELARLRHDLEELERKSGHSDELRGIRDRLVKLEAGSTSERVSGGVR